MKRIIFSILLLLPFLVYAQTQTDTNRGSANKMASVKPEATMPRIGYADLKAIRVSYKAMKDEKQQFKTNLKSQKDSSSTLFALDKSKSDAAEKGRIKALEQKHLEMLQQLERNIQKVIQQIAFEKKYPRISFQLADKLAGAEDITKEILEKLQ